MSPRISRPEMSEKDLLNTVLDMCRFYRVRTAHFRPALTRDGRWVTPVQGDAKGWPDLALVGPGGALFRELKRQRGVLTLEQKHWQDVLRAAGLDVGVWRPSDLRSGRIKQEIEAIAQLKTA